MTSLKHQLAIGSMLRMKWLTEDAKSMNLMLKSLRLATANYFPFVSLINGHQIIHRSHLVNKEWVLVPTNGQVQADMSKPMSLKRKREMLCYRCEP
jgi:hypothetical protein